MRAPNAPGLHCHTWARSWALPRTRSVNRKRGAMPTAPSHEALIRRIRALCSKADASDFPEEAEAFLAKAQQLMTRHAIDDAILRRATGSSDDDIVSRPVIVPAPYASARVSLLAAAARANSCRLALSSSIRDGQRCFLVGHAADVDLTVALYDHLDQQAARAVRRASVGASRPRAFRHAFLLSYGVRVGQRLAAAAAATQAREEERRGTSVALAVRDRRHGVDRAFAARFPLTVSARRSASSTAGLAHGAAAADRATLGRTDLGGRRALPHGRTR